MQNYKSRARRELLNALKAELTEKSQTLLLTVKDPSKPVGKRHEAQTQYWLVSGELAMVNRKLRSQARARKAKAKAAPGILSLLKL